MTPHVNIFTKVHTQIEQLTVLFVYDKHIETST